MRKWVFHQEAQPPIAADTSIRVDVPLSTSGLITEVNGEQVFASGVFENQAELSYPLTPSIPALTADQGEEFVAVDHWLRMHLLYAGDKKAWTTCPLQLVSCIGS